MLAQIDSGVSGFLLTSGVIAAALTATITLVISIANYRQLDRIERAKVRAEFETFRFKELTKVKRRIEQSDIDFSNAELIEGVRTNDSDTIAQFASEIDDAYTRTLEVIASNSHLLSDAARSELLDIEAQVSAITQEIQQWAAANEIDFSTPEGDEIWQKTASRFPLMLEYVHEAPKAIERELGEINSYLLAS